MYKSYIKRLFDVVLCLIALPFFAIILIVVSILIKFDDRGPIIYKAARIGKNSTVFSMYKFRSMKVDAPNILNADGSTYNSKNDPRVTKTGRVLRETSIDEVPQILNILKGEMSIIGPRASGSGALGTYLEDEEPKMLVRPGLTGYTQAYFRNGLSVREKRLNDAWYAQNVTFRLDVKIFFKTIFTVLKGEGIYTNTEEVNEIVK
jgi:undecaprenyl phosphate N,N'-diacetylbacillosamine 1-phosphate transferase